LYYVTCFVFHVRNNGKHTSTSRTPPPSRSSSSRTKKRPRRLSLNEASPSNSQPRRPPPVCYQTYPTPPLTSSSSCSRENPRPTSRKRSGPSPDPVEQLPSFSSDMGTSVHDGLSQQTPRLSQLSSDSLPSNSYWRPFVPPVNNTLTSSSITVNPTDTRPDSDASSPPPLSNTIHIHNSCSTSHSLQSSSSQKEKESHTSSASAPSATPNFNLVSRESDESGYLTE